MSGPTSNVPVVSTVTCTKIGVSVPASARASFALYNTRAEVDALVEGLSFCRELFG